MNPSTKLGLIIYVLAVTALATVIATSVLLGRVRRLTRVVGNLQDRAILDDLTKLEQLGQ